jgi:hypothetical protein
MQINCSICGARATLQQHLYDGRYSYPGTFPLLKCANCEHAFQQGKFSSEQITNLYSQYYPRSFFKVENHQPHQMALDLPRRT